MIAQKATSVPAQPIFKALNEWRELQGWTWADISRAIDIDEGTLANMRRRTKYLEIEAINKMEFYLDIDHQYLYKYIDKINLVLYDCPLEVLSLFNSCEGREALREALEEFGEGTKTYCFRENEAEHNFSDLGTIEYDYTNREGRYDL